IRAWRSRAAAYAGHRLLDRWTWSLVEPGGYRVQRDRAGRHRDRPRPAADLPAGRGTCHPAACDPRLSCRPDPKRLLAHSGVSAGGRAEQSVKFPLADGMAFAGTEEHIDGTA